MRAATAPVVINTERVGETSAADYPRSAADYPRSPAKGLGSTLHE
jgi:hypothetical protein